jgi:O-antigen/teichoic acid export membrane protein
MAGLTSVRSELARVGAWGLSDQALLSGTSFVTVLAPARVLRPAYFGGFVLAYTSLLVLNGLQNALFTGPHNVLGTRRRGREYVCYTASTAASQIVFAVFFAGVAVVVAAGLAGDPGANHLAIAIAPAILAWQLQEFVRRVLYTEGRLSAAVANDVVSYGGQLLGILILWRAGHITGPALLLVIAATSSCGVVLGVVQLRSSLAFELNRVFVRENWDFGKWLAGANVGFWLSSAAILYIAGAILGAGAPAALKAGQIVLGPLNVLLLFLATVLPIVFSRALAQGEAALRSRLRFALTTTGPIVAAYCLAAALLAHPILHALYGGKYDGFANVVRLVAFYYFADYFAQVIRDVLKARRVTRPVFVGNLLGGIAAVALAPVLLVVIGVTGGAMAMVVGGLILNAALLRAFVVSRSDVVTPTGRLLPSQEAAPLR